LLIACFMAASFPKTMTCSTLSWVCLFCTFFKRVANTSTVPASQIASKSLYTRRIFTGPTTLRTRAHSGHLQRLKSILFALKFRYSAFTSVVCASIIEFTELISRLSMSLQRVILLDHRLRLTRVLYGN
jgi:hypothetical protein